MNNRESSTSTTRTAVTRKFWFRLDQPRKIKLWYWLLPLLWLLLLLFGWFNIAPAMQNQVEKRVSSTLQNASGVNNNYIVSEVSADGQNVLVKAIASLDQKDFIENTASKTTCDSWLAKQLTCPIDVDVELVQPVEVAKSPSIELLPKAEKIPEVVEPEVIEPVVEKVAHNFSFVKNDSGISLAGEVASDDVKTSVTDEASRLYTINSNNLIVTDLPQKFEDEWAYAKALSLLGLLNAGRANWVDGSLSVVGEVNEGNESAAKGMFDNSEFSDRLGLLDLTVIRVVDKCNEDFSILLAASKIKFNTGSARISKESDSLLSELAALASRCNIKLSVEGHTDNVGSARLNERLSLARARSVVVSLTEKGVASEILQAKGMGESAPVASNASEVGRQENRRIEIKAVN